MSNNTETTILLKRSDDKGDVILKKGEPYIRFDENLLYVGRADDCETSKIKAINEIEEDKDAANNAVSFTIGGSNSNKYNKLINNVPHADVADVTKRLYMGTFKPSDIEGVWEVAISDFDTTNLQSYTRISLIWPSTSTTDPRSCSWFKFNSEDQQHLVEPIKIRSNKLYDFVYVKLNELGLNFGVDAAWTCIGNDQSNTNWKTY